MKSLLAHLLKLKVFTNSVCNGAVDECSQLIIDELVQIKFQEFDRSKTCLDGFFFKAVNVNLFKDLVKVVKLVLTLNHGQASLERRFTINQSILETNMKE